MLAQVRLTNTIANLLALLAVGAILLAAVVWVVHRPMFQISRVEIAPTAGNQLQYVSPGGLQAALGADLAGNFFLLDLAKLRTLIEHAPWVRTANVRRIWPSILEVKIEEQQPLAFWNENQMINTWGEAFAANQGELPDGMNIPQLNGPANSQLLVVQRYAEIARWFAPLGLSVREATLSPRYAWDVILSDNTRLNLGRDPAADVADLHGLSGALPFAARIERFVQAWPQLQQRLAGRTIESADLRYPNGFAIALAPASATTPSFSTP